MMFCWWFMNAYLQLFKPEYRCNVCVYLLSILIGVYSTSIFSLIAVSVDRYWAICHPVSYRNSKGTRLTKCITASCWIIGMIFGSLPAIGWKNKDFDGNCYATSIADFSFLLASCIINCSATLGIIGLYGFIFSAINKQVSKIPTWDLNAKVLYAG